ncbi:MAG: glycerol-3-phosphate dehydrogenase, anaerobic, A subunit [Desulfobacterales bacterium RIFOXYA12_FULL_46_15]|nr:MAG: glycerol-3-phosphate dehydrogenase, anaerobic, A subunit [Desulfobacula sp. GWF2_41_7]OGR23106.1 MAG: glycerol-3-phosphate dehydrogenase, anaerobic, A subunit [Desulfobacterales bacterium RIFOXYA12_FULL_46_15]
METQVLIIGGGATGTGIARDLSLRGLNVILIEKQDLNAGASGGNHGLLHSGARYVCSDHEAAVECNNELNIIKRTAGHCVEETGGFFVAVCGDDEKYIADFPGMCRAAGIPFKSVDVTDARQMERSLSEKIIAVYEVNDASINPFKLSIENMNDAVSMGGQYFSYCMLQAVEMENKKVCYAKIQNRISNEIFYIKADTYVNASGAWAGRIAELAGIPINMVFSKGSLLVTSKRITKRVINRLRKAADGDILVPGGAVSILGTTSVRVDSPDNIFPTVDEVDRIITEGEKMIPLLKTCRYVRAYSGVRPLVSKGNNDDREVSRGFTLIDHEKDGVDNLVTITGGKLSTYRLMAEKTSDIICKKHGIISKCQTKHIVLPSTKSGEWSEPGLHITESVTRESRHDPILCECEIVPATAIDTIIRSIKNNKGKPDLTSIALRSRVGKGPCQGSFCSTRILSHMYNTGELTHAAGINDLRKFLNERWKGEQSLLWDQAIVQSSLKEMIHCGLFGLELETQ